MQAHEVGDHSTGPNISVPTPEEWQNAKPFREIPGPRGPPYIGRLYHYKLTGEQPPFPVYPTPPRQLNL